MYAMLYTRPNIYYAVAYRQEVPPHQRDRVPGRCLRQEDPDIEKLADPFTKTLTEKQFNKHLEAWV